MRAYERFLNYVVIDTMPDETSMTSPSTLKQFDLLKKLQQELSEIGVQDVLLTEKGYLYAHLPATPGYEKVPAIGFVSHVDTAPCFSGTNVKPLVHKNYDGEDVVLPTKGRVLRTESFPFLKELKGRTLITTDGSTLLGADDKAGVAEIMTLCEALIHSEKPHGKVCIAFTPDEEIGAGTAHFDVKAFGADFAFTMDGGAVGGIEYENFNAASATVQIKGFEVHPGSAKGIMVNAVALACEMANMIPKEETPEKTEGYEGFYFLENLQGNCSNASMHYIIRDHDLQQFENRKETIRKAADRLQTCYPKAKIELEIKDSYRNMREKIEPCMHLIENAKKACEAVGIQPEILPIRGGTDGAHLSFMGVPCPNLGTGGHNFHGPYECIDAESMDMAVEMMKKLVEIYAAVK